MGKTRDLFKRGTKTGMHLGAGGIEIGVRSSHQGNCLGQRSVRGYWRVQQLTCDRLNGMRITQTILSAVLLTPDRDASPLESETAGSWSIGPGEQSQGEVCCWLQGDSLWGSEGRDHGGQRPWRKAKQPWRQSDTAESCTGGGAITVVSLPTQQCQQLSNWERPQRVWPFKCLTHWAIAKDPSQVGPLSAWTSWATEDQSKRPFVHWVPEARKRLLQCHRSCENGCQKSCVPGIARVPVIQATMLRPCLIPTGTELPEARKKLLRASYLPLP